MYNGLSLEQAPPLSVPMRFFVSACLFAVAGGVAMLGFGASAFASRWTPQMLVLTHLFAVGFCLMVMLGALFQMLPVVAGAVIKQAPIVAALLHPLMVFGLLGLCFGFMTGQWAFSGFVIGLLVAGMLAFCGLCTWTLFEARAAYETVTGMKYALLALALTVLMGAWLAAGHGGSVALARPVLSNLHLSMGIAGWMALLIISISYQVIPMFHMTPAYSQGMRRYLTPCLAVGLVVLALLQSFGFTGYGTLCSLAIILLWLGYCATTLWLVYQRKRKLRDQSLYFWILGLTSSALGATMTVVPNSVNVELAAGVLMIGGAMAVICGMLYKIVPFLVWFHLQSRQRIDTPTRRVPNMREIIPTKYARWHFYCHFTALLILMVATFIPDYFVSVGACALIAGFSIQTVAIVKALLLYRTHCLPA